MGTPKRGSRGNIPVNEVFLSDHSEVHGESHRGDQKCTIWQSVMLSEDDLTDASDFVESWFGRQDAYQVYFSHLDKFNNNGMLPMFKNVAHISNTFVK